MDLEAIRNTLQKTLSTANNILREVEHPKLNWYDNHRYSYFPGIWT